MSMRVQQCIRFARSPDKNMDLTSSDNFDPAEYVKQYYPNSIEHYSTAQFLLRKLLQFCNRMKFTADSMKILEYGSGPHPIYALGLSPVANEIVLAEYAESHRAFVEKWHKKDPNSYDWSFYFQYVAKLLEEGGTQVDANDLEEVLRKKIVTITPCDITKSQCITEGYEGPYDIVFSSLCLEAASKSLDEYKNAMKRLVSLVKQNGYVLLFSTVRENCDVGFYTVNGVKLWDVALKRKDVLETCYECGLNVLEEETFNVPPDPTWNVDNFTFFAFQKC